MRCQLSLRPGPVLLSGRGSTLDRMTGVQIVRRDSAAVMPWRNGAGTTREYCKVGGEEFDWRLSVAEIVQAGPFSTFPGIDRILVLLTGDGVHLRFGTGEVVSLAQPLQLVRFAGETAVDSTPLGGATTDLNLMWRRDRFTADVAIIEQTGPGRLDGEGTNVAFVASGAVRVGGDELGVGDVVRWQGALDVDASDATLVHFTLLPR